MSKADPGWRNTGSLVVAKYSPKQNKFKNPTFVFPSQNFPYRSTLVKDADGNWKAIEVSKKYAQKADPFEALDGETEVITALSSKNIPLCVLGVPVSAEDRADAEGATADFWRVEKNGKELVRYRNTPRTFLFNPEGVKLCPVELGNIEKERHTYGECIYGTNLYEEQDIWLSDLDPAREPFELPWYGQTRFTLRVPVPEAEVAVQAKAKAKSSASSSKQQLPPVIEEQSEQQAPEEMVVVVEDSFFHDGFEYNEKKSSLKELQALCREYQLKTTGSKKQLLRRLATAVREERLDASLQQQRRDFEEYSAPALQQRTAKPSAEEIELHNLTHLPFAAWCEHCIATRGKEDPRRSGLAKATSSSDSSKPRLSFDFCYTSTAHCEDPPAVALVLSDSWSKTFLTIPVQKRGGAANISHMVEGIVHFRQ